MSKRFLGFWPVLVLMILLWSCANRGRPSGGEVDVNPPVIINSNPENYTTNFNATEIRITFDEFVKIKNLQKQLIISPPMKYEPEITPLGAASRYIKIKITDTLPPNTTYAINFGNSIVDNNEENPYPYFRYVFSTGPVIDSLSVRGIVIDAVEKEAEPFISVMLYEKDSSYSDSIVFKSKPRYITNTLDSLKTFSVENMKAGTYKLLALKDVNSNYLFNPENDKIGFIEGFIEVPKDTLYKIKLFKEVLPFKVERPKQVGENRIMFPYAGQLKDLKIEMLEGQPDNFESKIVKDERADSVYFWYRPKLELDSTFFRVSSQKYSYSDTLQHRFRKAEKDTLVISPHKVGNIDFGEALTLKATTPFATVDTSLITIIDKDSLPVQFTVKLDTLLNRYSFPIELKEEESYKIEVFPGAFTDFYGSSNDTLNYSLRTKSKSAYGNLRVNLVNAQMPMLVQLVSANGDVKYERYVTNSSNVDFTYLVPNTYALRVIYDTNANGVWDSGNFLSNTQPERISYFPEDIEIRANFDLIYEFSLEK